jgi:hypothetical protein
MNDEDIRRKLLSACGRWTRALEEHELPAVEVAIAAKEFVRLLLMKCDPDQCE